MSETDSGAVNRRGLLRAGISALAAGLLLKVVGSDRVMVERVQANDGSSVMIGQGNTGFLTTTLSSPVADYPAVYFVNTGPGDAQAIQGNMTGTGGRAFVGYASATIGNTIALDGVCNSPTGIGLRGANTAISGNAIGVQGSTESSTGAIFLGRGPTGTERIRMQPDSVKFSLTWPHNFQAGYEGNSITAGVTGGTISGGGASAIANNRVTDDYGTVGGGVNNQAGDGKGSTNDREWATVGGGSNNTASGTNSTVGGGGANIASGIASTVPGGYNNTVAGDYSFAAGRRAKNINPAHDGVFIFADEKDFDFNSAAPNEFATRCTGGVRFVSGIDGSGNPTAGVALAAGGNSWSGICDRSLKENFRELDGQEVLERLSRVSITEWNLKAQDPSIRHVGPMAQDFYTAFRLGEDDRCISTIDLDGIALRSIQALYNENKQLKHQFQLMQQKNLELQQKIQQVKEGISS